MLNIKASSNMKSPDEDRVIRVPMLVRRELGIRWGELLRVRIGKNTPLLMIANKALESDIIEENDGFCWITKNTFNYLHSTEKDYIVSSVEEASKPEKVNVTVGCDPEFFVTSKKFPHLVVPANQIGLEHTDRIGSDNTLGELRPFPGKDHKALMRNLEVLVKQIPSKIGNDRVAKAMSAFANMTAGFHIHFGVPQKLLIRDKDTMAIIKSLIKCLDYFVGVTSTVGETENMRRTSNIHYGFPGDYRVKLRTLEYRTPGAYLLRSPVLSAGVVAISKLVVDDVITKLDVMTDGWTKFKPKPNYILQAFIRKEYKIPNAKEVAKMIVSPDKNRATQESANALETLSRLRKYGTYSEEIESLFTMVATGNIPSPEFVGNW